MVNLAWWSDVIDILPLPRRHLDRYDPQGWPWNRLLAVLQPLARAPIADVRRRSLCGGARQMLP